MAGQPTVLIVDDEVRSLETLSRVLGEDFDVLAASGAPEANGILESDTVQAILCDQRMPGITGVEFLKQVRERWPDPVRMILSGYTDSEDIISGINEAGIYQYITKPWQPDNLLRTVHGAVRLYGLQQENQNVSLEIKKAEAPLRREIAAKRRRLKEYFGFDQIIHAPGSPVAGVCRLAAKCAGYDVSVLITGESGTGKELLARAIHYNSPRAERSFVVQNCGALPDELLESELFGCKKGAFTGAYADRTGLFEQADGGTIFLDEIGDTSSAFQVKLLRVLQEGEIRPLGSQRTRRVDVRVISATNKHLEREVETGRFRRDLYYRLAGFPLHLPPLRERPMDISLIAEKILGESMRHLGRSVDGFSPEVLNLFAGYTWPGNVRDMQNEIRRMLVLNEGLLLDVDALSERLRNGMDDSFGDQDDEQPANPCGPLKDKVERFEQKILSSALRRHQGNISRVADELGLSRVGLRGKLRRYGLHRNGEP